MPLKTVLIIDDDHALLKTLRRIFAACQTCRVETADNGYAGIERFDAGSIDLVITDIRMPGIDGSYVARHVRLAGKGRVPVIGMSGTPELMDRRLFDAVLHKPFDTGDLRMLLSDFGIFL
ncbi:MAG: response regulator [Thermodesulfobacteriota bacterium]|nr:response regulator [Thermodesulfobacteriota bacterium]